MTTLIDRKVAMAVRPENLAPNLWRVHHAAVMLSVDKTEDLRGRFGAGQPLGRARLVSDGVELSPDELEPARPALIEAARQNLLRNIEKAKVEVSDVLAALDVIEHQARAVDPPKEEGAA